MPCARPFSASPYPQPRFSPMPTAARCRSSQQGRTQTNASAVSRPSLGYHRTSLSLFALDSSLPGLYLMLRRRMASCWMPVHPVSVSRRLDPPTLRNSRAAHASPTKLSSSGSSSSSAPLTCPQASLNRPPGITGSGCDDAGTARLITTHWSGLWYAVGGLSGFC